MSSTILHFFFCTVVSSLKLRVGQNPAPAVNLRDIPTMSPSRANWMAFEAICTSSILTGSNILSPPRPLTLVSVYNHGMCFESDTFSSFCHCRSMEVSVPGRSQLTAFHINFNYTQWQVMEGHVCKDWGYTDSGHSWSFGHNWHHDFDNCDGPQKWEQPLRKAWYQWRNTIAHYISAGGEDHFVTMLGAMSSPDFIAYPLTWYGGVGLPFHICHSPLEMGAMLGAATLGAYCNGTQTGPGHCGPGGRDHIYMNAAFCPFGEKIAIVQDVVGSFSSTNSDDHGSTVGGFYLYLKLEDNTTVGSEDHWRMRGLGVGFLPGEDPKNNRLSERLLCSDVHAGISALTTNVVAFPPGKKSLLQTNETALHTLLEHDETAVQSLLKHLANSLYRDVQFESIRAM